MIHYKRAVFITLVEFIVVLAAVLLYTRLYLDRSYFQQVILISLAIYSVAVIGSYLLIESKVKVVIFLYTVISLTLYLLGYLIYTLGYMILIYLITACVLTIFLEYRYIVVFGIASTLLQLMFGLVHTEIIRMVYSPYVYYFYLFGYIVGVFNMYLLVRHTKQAMERTERANHSKNAFVAAMAHEIRTPMNAILSLTEKILDDQEPEAVMGNAEKIINASNILLSMTNGILDYALIESGKYSVNENSYQPYGMIREVTDMTNIRLLNSEVDFVWLKENEVPVWLHGDELRIRQILINILANAVKYTRQGQITMKVGWHGNENEGELVISISDTGSGIKEEDLELIFDSFMRLKYGPKTEGTGLGLTICKQLIEYSNCIRRRGRFR
jgi:signal transduction histidine kinase